MADDRRFVVTYEKGGLATPGTKILVDRVTGVNYLFVQNGYAGGLTPLLDREGKPVITPVSPWQE